MIKGLEKAVERVRALPEDRQAYAAQVLDEIADEAVAYKLSSDERDDLSAALEEMEHGEVASDADVAAVFARLTA